MQVETPLYRPPSEAGSLILQVTLGCSYNRCTFCSMYRGKRFRVRPREQISELIREAGRELGPEVRRVFLADGDAMCLSYRRLRVILDQLCEVFPRLHRVGVYANARDVLRKSPEQLEGLRRRKLRILYMGLESGDDETLAKIEKGATAAQIVEAVVRARAAGMRVSVMVLVGLAGRERSLIHARASGEAIDRMEPNYTALLTYTPVPSPLLDELERGDFELPTPIGSLREIRELLANVSCRTYFSCNHASNYLPLKGYLPEEQGELLRAIDAAIAGQIPLKPEILRGL